MDTAAPALQPQFKTIPHIVVVQNIYKIFSFSFSSLCMYIFNSWLQQREDLYNLSLSLSVSGTLTPHLFYTSLAVANKISTTKTQSQPLHVNHTVTFSDTWRLSSSCLFILHRKTRSTVFFLLISILTIYIFNFINEIKRCHSYSRMYMNFCMDDIANCPLN